jgi:hypothetical protein
MPGGDLNLPAALDPLFAEAGVAPGRVGVKGSAMEMMA